MRVGRRERREEKGERPNLKQQSSSFSCNPTQSHQQSGLKSTLTLLTLLAGDVSPLAASGLSFAVRRLNIFLSSCTISSSMQEARSFVDCVAKRELNQCMLDAKKKQRISDKRIEHRARKAILSSVCCSEAVACDCLTQQATSRHTLEHTHTKQTPFDAPGVCWPGHR